MRDRQLHELRARLAEVADLEKAMSLLNWDQQTQMPPGGAPARAEQVATLRRVAHQRLASAEVGHLLEGLRAHEQRLAPESDEASLIRVGRRDHERARRVPADLRAEIARAGVLAKHRWIEARARADYELIRPLIERNVELARRYAACFEDLGVSPYDALLDDYEHGRTADEIQAVFDRLKSELRPLIAAVVGRGEPIEHAFLHGHFPEDRQRAVVTSILESFGFDPRSWRLDPTPHPFAASSSVSDIRITTRYDAQRLGTALFVAMHEFGHGLYESGVAPELGRSPLGRGVSLGLHESQSRLWENFVGHSRALWRQLYPRLQAAFPEHLKKVELEDFYRAINRVRPSLTRVTADEATYNLHVILRFELERELFDGSLTPRELPEAWDAAIESHLGLSVPDAGQGVLQDIHWAAALFGYFPTYALGNVMSAQIWSSALADLPHLAERMEPGDLAELRAWLAHRLHRHGRKFTPRETLELVSGADLDPAPYLDYLRAKLGDVYGLELSTQVSFTPPP